ncbi:MAG: ElaA protein [Paraglaciecola sp.]|jgi:ElaA protein
MLGLFCFVLQEHNKSNPGAHSCVKLGLGLNINCPDIRTMNFICLPFTDLSSTQLYEILHLRSEVFVVEQSCVYQDVDRKDTQRGVRHLMMLDKAQLLGYARLLPPRISYDTPSIGRILISPAARNKGLGRVLIQESMDRARALWPTLEITIGAQSHLSHLYQSFGFKKVSADYLEDGISHVDMQTSLV